ncbi:MAG: OmpA family protein [Deltaproteobacteria bacterium]|nr:OmpA family protein [Deltaproteobacteria bacterium]
MASSADKPVIVIKKKGGGHGHHGGAWKIAYADFVTAMMAFFLCMWLVNTADAATKSAIARYFKKPGVFEMGSGTPLEIGGAGILPDAFAPSDHEEEVEDGTVVKPKKSMFEQSEGSENPNAKITGSKKEGSKEKKEGGNPYLDKSFLTRQDYDKISLRELIEKFKQNLLQLRLSKSLGNILMTVEGKSLKIEFSDLPEGGLFYSGSAQLKPEAYTLIKELSSLLSDLDNEFTVTGHTDSSPLNRGTYTNWELSTDRANAFRQAIFASGINPDRLKGVRGVADREPLKGFAPDNPINRRVTLEIILTEQNMMDLGLKEGSISEPRTDADSPKAVTDKPTHHSSNELGMTPEQRAIFNLHEGARIFDPFD